MFTYQLTPEVVVKMSTVFDAEASYDLLERNRAYFDTYLRFLKKIRSVEDMAAFTRQEIEAFARGEGLGMGLWMGGHLIGNLAVKQFRPDTKTAEIAYLLDPAYTGQGIMTTAVQWLIGELFSIWGAQKIEIACDPANTASRGIPTRLGFRHEGTIRHAFANNGQVTDMMLWGLLRSEWT